IYDGSWKETIPLTDTRTEMASGLINQRRRFTRQYIKITVNLLLTQAEWVEFRLRLHSLGHVFNEWLNPLTDETVQCRIMSEITADWVELNQGEFHYKVAFEMERLG
ncbi:MAG: hypothetical protein KAG66_18690, partial [Methylococcales bacterium]|nr:hypothetical protein [Methylococcales bacterium]